MSALSPLSLDAKSWSALLAGDQPVVMVSVASIAGSTPREAGAFMLVGCHETAGTVGGGNLEHQLVRHVRKMLADGAAPDAHFMRYPLGPALGQCCGGAVDVAFHALNPTRKAVLKVAIAKVQAGSGGGAGVWLMLPCENAASSTFTMFTGPAADALMQHFGTLRGGLVKDAQACLSGFSSAAQSCDWANNMVSSSSNAALMVRLDDAATPLWLFGAGHVGAAIVRALEPLPFDIHWVDSRADYIDIAAQSRLHPVHSPNPWEEIADLPAGAMALILTHSHAEDFEICRHALLRPDLSLVGMIGSATKRARFMARMRERGLADGALARLCCPIGVEGITGKHPAVIAASVAAQLVGLREQGLAQTLPSPARAQNDLG
ncbi:xanthine dehydrogenase accessory protein XdhC [Thalassospira marina]|uniref:Xanthine dehydrogenase accessory protein XdhC n=1 Tax=Thalassospira marina TaxID=2048283 RepID=A0A2N3KGN5_9PROT|nr:xanthine dehydrogenase accessory protein XdhC [Thalassospira marina]PKR49694.1 xanthine dehydrogenase accessory protein XdhC [Thalassospira marina]